MKKQKAQSPLLTSPLGRNKIRTALLRMIIAGFFIFPPYGGIKGGCQPPTEAEQIQTLQKQLSAWKKTSKEETESLQHDIDFLQIGSNDVNELLKTHDIRLMTNKILIQGALEGTIAQIKEEQEATSSGYARTKKIVWAALAAGVFAMCGFIVALILIHLRNKKNNYLFIGKLHQYKSELVSFKMAQEKDSADLKTELNQLRAEWRLGAEARQQAIDETRLRITTVEAAAAAHKKLSDERTTSLAYFQQQMEDKLDAVKKSAESTADELKKQLSDMEMQLELAKEHIHKNKITH